jgi:DNA-binding ferritin-like protein (Dps family)
MNPNQFNDLVFSTSEFVNKIVEFLYRSSVDERGCEKYLDKNHTDFCDTLNSDIARTFSSEYQNGDIEINHRFSSIDSLVRSD